MRKKQNGEKRPTLKVRQAIFKILTANGIQADSNALEKIRIMLFEPRFEKAFLNSASLIDTAINECYHSLSLLYAPKRFAWLVTKQLALLHAY